MRSPTARLSALVLTAIAAPAAVVALDRVVAEAPLVRRLYLVAAGGRLRYPAARRDAADAATFEPVIRALPATAWERVGKRLAVAGTPVCVVALRTARRAPVVAAYSRDLEALRRDVLAASLAGPESPTIVAVLAAAGQPVYSRAPLDRAEQVLAVGLSDALPDWRVAVYAPPGTTPRDAVRRQVMMFTSAFAVLLAVLAVGIGLCWRLMRRETEMARLKSDFVANVSHDLKTPLSVIRMFGETLELGRVPDEERRREPGRPRGAAHAQGVRPARLSGRAPGRRGDARAAARRGVGLRALSHHADRRHARAPSAAQDRGRSGSAAVHPYRPRAGLPVSRVVRC